MEAVESRLGLSFWLTFTDDIFFFQALQLQILKRNPLIRFGHKLIYCNCFSSSCSCCCCCCGSSSCCCSCMPISWPLQQRRGLLGQLSFVFAGEAHVCVAALALTDYWAPVVVMARGKLLLCLAALAFLVSLRRKHTHTHTHTHAFRYRCIRVH